MRRRLRILVGLMAWGGGLATIGWLVTDHVDGELGQQVAPQLWQYAAGRRTTVSLEVTDQLDIRAGDPIFRVSSNGQLEQIGEIQHTDAADKHTALLYASSPTPGASDQLAWYSNPDSMAWVVSTLMPESKRKEVSAEIRRAVAGHHEELLGELQPLVAKSLNQSLAIVESELPAAIRANREDIDRIGRRYQKELIDRELLPLVRREIWPLVRRRAEPTANKIGGELWKRVSLWRFTWRFAYDKIPLFPNRQKFREEFDRFVDQEALPVLANHSDDIVQVVEQIIRDASANPRVQQAARRSGTKVLEDPELKQLLWRIVRRTAVDNPKFRQAFRDTWTGPEARLLVSRTSQRFEPTVRRIGELLIGTPESGITPEFAAVLRNQVLRKDRRWLVLETADTTAANSSPDPAGSLAVVRGHRKRLSPFLAHIDTPSRLPQPEPLR